MSDLAPRIVDGEPFVCPKGFIASGMSAGIKPSRKPDLALIALEPGCEAASAAGMFTTNLLTAAPVLVSKRHLVESKGRARAVLVNSGCANAATGAEGMAKCERTVSALASALGCAKHDVQVASTGLIGSTLPDETIVSALPALIRAARPDGLPDAAEAIITTDSMPKAAQASATHEGRTFRVAGFAKGSGMIHPNMATLLVYLLTDAAVEPEPLQAMLRHAVDRSIHRITVDGDTSTNDTALVLASGAAGEFPAALVQNLLTRVARSLAIQVVRDGEGARKLLHVRVEGATDGAQALRVAQTVASSLLVRTALAGGDPNWGRIIAAVGRADPRVNLDRLEARAGGEVFFTKGAPLASARDTLAKSFGSGEAVIDLSLGLGGASDEFFSCDLTEGYIRLNASYST